MASKQRYQVVRKIDAGGMAEIYIGKGLSLQGIEKTVAIKRILPNLTQKPKFVTMFLDEARLSMRLNHANIVQVFDVGRSGGTYFLIMEKGST
jgi:eukaryotic-like serine/threonine-protein kinase